MKKSTFIGAVILVHYQELTDMSTPRELKMPFEKPHEEGGWHNEAQKKQVRCHSYVTLLSKTEQNNTK